MEMFVYFIYSIYFIYYSFSHSKRQLFIIAKSTDEGVKRSLFLSIPNCLITCNNLKLNLLY